jgi:predicted lipoprotein with Yx(FWY)xxD motif
MADMVAVLAAALVLAGTPVGAHGSTLVDAKGRTLYTYAGGVKCTGACARLWPPLLTSGKPVAKDGVAALKLGVVKRADGKLQVTYGGKPLYRYARDVQAGDARGAGIARWAVAKSAPVTPPDSGYGGGGYGP